MTGRATASITCPHCLRAIGPLTVRVHLALVERARPTRVCDLAVLCVAKSTAVSCALTVLRRQGLVERVSCGLWAARGE